MGKEIHVLNGDALKEQFPQSLQGKLIVARECLLDGPVTGSDLDQFFATREHYLSSIYPDLELDYSADIASEFNKLLQVAENTSVNLWFEDDLFCQVNLWFVCSLISNHTTIENIYLIRPETDLEYGFGGLSTEGLVNAYEVRTSLSQDELAIFTSLWSLYQQGKHQLIMEKAQPLLTKFPFLKNTIQANSDRFPENEELGRPDKVLLEIMNELGDEKFEPVFQKFHHREPIYGFGDGQVKRLFNKLKT